MSYLLNKLWARALKTWTGKVLKELNGFPEKGTKFLRAVRLMSLSTYASLRSNWSFNGQYFQTSRISDRKSIICAKSDLPIKYSVC